MLDSNIQRSVEEEVSYSLHQASSLFAGFLGDPCIDRNSSLIVFLTPLSLSYRDDFENLGDSGDELESFESVGVDGLKKGGKKVHVSFEALRTN